MRLQPHMLYFNSSRALAWLVWAVPGLEDPTPVPQRAQRLDEGGLADAVVAAHKHLGHVQRHSARVEQAQQVALLIVDGAGGASKPTDIMVTSKPIEETNRVGCEHGIATKAKEKCACVCVCVCLLGVGGGKGRGGLP